MEIPPVWKDEALNAESDDMINVNAFKADVVSKASFVSTDSSPGL